MVGLFVAALLLFALGVIPTSIAPDRRPVAESDVLAVAPVAAGISPAGSGAKPVSIVLGSSWTLVTLLLVFVVVALGATTASSSRAAWCRRRAPPSLAG